MQLDPRLNFVEIAQNTWCDYSTHNNRKLNAVLVINDEGTNSCPMRHGATTRALSSTTQVRQRP